jgi:alkanesulfonate monooxygenase SsuD/methylene tetrahydromethanopterin reductase-like flavin-dependent oxidoreductase (luciferase family)
LSDPSRIARCNWRDGPESLGSTSCPLDETGLFLPLFEALADPAVVARLAGAAEEAGWDGFFLWDQIRWREPVAAVGDTQVTLRSSSAWEPDPCR